MIFSSAKDNIKLMAVLKGKLESLGGTGLAVLQKALANGVKIEGFLPGIDKSRNIGGFYDAEKNTVYINVNRHLYRQLGALVYECQRAVNLQEQHVLEKHEAVKRGREAYIQNYLLDEALAHAAGFMFMYETGMEDQLDSPAMQELFGDIRYSGSGGDAFNRYAAHAFVRMKQGAGDYHKKGEDSFTALEKHEGEMLSPSEDFKTEGIAAYNPELTEESWEAGKKPWRDTLQGRAAIRAFSRGIMGAAGFTLGGYIANRAMHGYTPEVDVNFLKNPVQGIARIYDKVFGKSLKGAANALGRDGEYLVNSFRDTVHFPGYKQKFGRSLGHEVVMVTFDFASMSIGDFWGRKIAYTLDPNLPKPKWRRDDGSVNWAEAVKTFGKNWFTAVTYAAGEDWAVAVPYVLTMRHVGTPVINKFVPGYKFDFDRGGHGGGMRVDQHGHITGNFTAGGVFNLWERFTTYNVGTLMFREAYNWVGGRLKYWWKTGEAPALVEHNPEDPKRSATTEVIDGTKQLVNWLARSTAKAVMYMVPAVPFFWITRVPQHKFMGRFIHPEKGLLSYRTAEGVEKLLQANTPLAERSLPVFFSQTGEKAASPFLHGAVDPHAKTWGFIDALLNPVAKGADKVRDTFRQPIGGLIESVTGAAKGTGAGYADTYLSASMAYAPYFWAKSDWLADKWDYGRMDAGIDRTLSGAFRVKPAEFKAGIGEIWQALRDKPLKDPLREQYAQCLIATDETPSDNKFDVNPHAGENCDFIIEQAKKPEEELKKIGHAPAALKSGLNWRERIFSGKAEDKPELHSDKPTTYAEQEEMRKALEMLHPPTNSVH